MSVYLSQELRRLLEEADNGQCVYCQTTVDNTGQALTVDHIVPTAKGGETSFVNLTIQPFINPVHPTSYHFADDGSIPNNPTLPLLVYPGVLRLTGPDPASIAEQVFGANGWGDSWRNGIYPFPHYHSTAHEVLAICRGQAQVRFGGDQGVVLAVHAGDVVVIPAGVGHQNLGASADLLVVGAYPPKQSVDLCYGKGGERPQVLANITQVPLPITDPVCGEAGPLLAIWQ